MEKYVLAGYSITETSNKIEAICVVDQDEFNIIQCAIKSLGNFDKNQSVYHIFRGNHEDLINFYEEAKDKLNQGKFNQEVANNTVEGINRRLISYLSSFKTFIDSWEKRLKPLNNVEEGEFNLYRLFKDRTSFHWDNNFSYRLFDQLRNYVQHCGLPAIVLQIRALPKSQERYLSIFLGRDELLKDTKLKKKVADELKNEPELIDLIINLLDFNDCIEDINRICTLIDFYSVAKEWNLLMDMYDEVKEKLPQSSPCLAISSSIGLASEKPSKQRIKMRLFDFPKRTMIKMQEMEPSLREFALMGAPSPQK